MVDYYVEVFGGINNYNYVNVEFIVDIVECMDVYVVWVGWGYVLENFKFLEFFVVLLKKIVFIGFLGFVMCLFGDKIFFIIVVQYVDVLCILWFGIGVF